MGATGPVRKVPTVRHRPERVLPAVPGVFQSCRTRAGASADRRRKRTRQRTFPLRPRRHRDTGMPELGSRRGGMAVPHRLAGRAQRRPEQDGAVHTQPLLRPRLRDQRVRGVVQPSVDLRLHARRRRIFGHVLFDLVAPTTRRHLRRATGYGARAGRAAVPWNGLGGPGHLALSGVHRVPALAKVDAKPYMAMRKWATQFYEVPATPPDQVPASV